MPITQVVMPELIVRVQGAGAALNGLAREFMSLARALSFGSKTVRGQRRIVPAGLPF